MSGPGTAAVLGTTGVTGTPFAEQLLMAGWTVYGVSRRRPQFKAGTPLQQFVHLPVDLQDTAALQNALRAAPDISHVFHCANASSSAARVQSMANLLDALEAGAPHFRNISLLQGMKYYGCYLGPFKTPAREDDPRIADNDFYYDEEDLIRQRRAGKSWTWTALRPHSVCGYAAGNPLNLAMVLAVYATICREIGEPLRFPATLGCFQSRFQVMDAEMLARAAINVATDPTCANNIYNVSNGDFFRWQELWPAIAGFFELTAEGPGGPPLADFLAQHKKAWDSISARYGLQPFPIERAPAWVRGDYTAPNSRFSAEYDIISDTTKFQNTELAETIDNASMFLRLFERYRSERIIP
jgi:nucleoside-diphosphate-sugar epimerase